MLERMLASLLIVLIFGLCICIPLGFSWILLSAWNWFVISAELSLTVPVNWGTVIGLFIIICFVRYIFQRNNSD